MVLCNWEVILSCHLYYLLGYPKRIWKHYNVLVLLRHLLVPRWRFLCRILGGLLFVSILIVDLWILSILGWRRSCYPLLWCIFLLGLGFWVLLGVCIPLFGLLHRMGIFLCNLYWTILYWNHNQGTSSSHSHIFQSPLAVLMLYRTQFPQLSYQGLHNPCRWNRIVKRHKSYRRYCGIMGNTFLFHYLSLSHRWILASLQYWQSLVLDYIIQFSLVHHLVCGGFFGWWF